MAYNYHYIDDNPPARNRGIARGWEIPDSLDITPHDATAWDDQVEEITQLISNGVSGFILDWRLNEHGTNIHYSAEALAEQIRFIIKDQNSVAVPIILVSQSIDDFRRRYEGNLSVNGLFDSQYSKEDLMLNSNKQQIIAIAAAYQTLNDLTSSNESPEEKIQNLFSMANCSDLHPDFIESLQIKMGMSVSDTVQFILNSIILHPSFLIEEDWVAARLGIDKANSSDWDRLKNVFLASAKYNGIFANAWERWWMFGIEQWWRTNMVDKSLQNTPTPERVDRIKECTGLQNLAAATKLPFCKSDNFWTICQGHKKPLGMIDGLTIRGQSNLAIWQEKKQISFDAAIQRIKIDEWEAIAAQDKPKFEKLKSFYADRYSTTT